MPIAAEKLNGSPNPSGGIADNGGSSVRKGDPLATMLTMIEPCTSQTSFDKCLMAPADANEQSALLRPTSTTPMRFLLRRARGRGKKRQRSV